MNNAELQSNFDCDFRSHIERFAEPLVAILLKLISTERPNEFEVVIFEIQSDWSRFPVHAFAMDREAINEMYFEPPFCGDILPEACPLIPKDAIDQDRYEEDGVATFESGARVLAEWFGECWHAAGGAMFPLPAYIHHHDSSRYFDLRARRWIRAAEIGT